MTLSCGIVGLPNVGKSTLFNCLTSMQAESANYPFCTIEPNVGVVDVPDDRLDALATIVQPQRILPASISFVDIAGLVKGASTGEGLGNKFLNHIRDVDAICHVVRCFEDENIIHVDNRINPLSDIETIETELVLADLATASKTNDRYQKNAKGTNVLAKKIAGFCQDLVNHLDAGKPARNFSFNNEDDDFKNTFRDMHLLTAKPMFFIANVDENGFDPKTNPHLATLIEFAQSRGETVVAICAKIEAELADLDPEERNVFLEDLGMSSSGLTKIIRAAFKLLKLQTYLTAGVQEVRAWTIKEGTKAPGAAGVIHTDFERGFIKADVIWWEDFVKHKGEAGCRAAGAIKLEGKDYVVKDGDVIHFKFNV
ncbi:MAG: redox-regulated ATPase YchF [bacterium]|nr:redox-regulated ATPase YchF [bacterium]